MELGQVDEALNFFDKALAKNKKYPEGEYFGCLQKGMHKRFKNLSDI